MLQKVKCPILTLIGEKDLQVPPKENLAEIEKALKQVPFEKNKPSCIIAHTVKGKGVSFMENKLLWHYRVPDGEEYKAAMRELGVS